MKKIILMTLTLFYFSPALFAHGIGANVSYYHGRIEANNEKDDSGVGYKERWVIVTAHPGIGFLYDSNVSQKNLINYRLRVGLAFGRALIKKKRIEFPSGIYNSKRFVPSIYEINLFFSLGFGIVTTKYLKFWLGPNFGFSFIKGLYDEDYYDISYKPGLIIGINFNMKDNITLTYDCGILFIPAAYVNKPGEYYGFEGFINMGVMKRFGEIRPK